ncbi:hypothetical protein [Mesorhizobium sp.]|uniref:hypothetical protein n=1 Tax=Mesorhizobium sp. TaxID=1871066 RepID=UPI00257AC97E|nr:hypothetical protein [Mesorhizobium sp.]
MKRTPELEAMLSADETDVSNKNAKRNQVLGAAALLLGGAIAAYFVLAGAQERPRDVLDGDEEFRTTTFRPPRPSFVMSKSRRRLLTVRSYRCRRLRRPPLKKSRTRQRSTCRHLRHL